MSKIKVWSPYFNHGMSYKVLSEKTYLNYVDKGKIDASLNTAFIRYIGEFPEGNLKTLEEKFGQEFVSRQLITGSNIREKEFIPINGNKDIKYIPGFALAMRLNIRHLANTKYWDKSNSIEPDYNKPNIFQRFYRFFCDLLHPPKIMKT